MPPFDFIEVFSLFQRITTKNSSYREKHHIHWKNGREKCFKAARLYGWKAQNHKRMLVVHLAMSLCVWSVYVLQ